MKTMNQLSDIFKPLKTPLEILDENKDVPLRLDLTRKYFVIACANTSHEYINEIRKILIREVVGHLVDNHVEITNLEFILTTPGQLKLMPEDWVRFAESDALLIIDGGFWKQSDFILDLISRTQRQGEPVIVYPLDRILTKKDWNSVFSEDGNV